MITLGEDFCHGKVTKYMLGDKKFSPTIFDHLPHQIVDYHISRIVTKNIFV